MKHSIILTYFLLISTFSFSCKNNNTIQPEITFEGITETSDKGPEPIGNIDPDDWKAMMNCSSIPKIGNINNSDTVGPVVTIPKCTKIYPVYPNPANKSFAVNFSLNEADSVFVTLNSSPSNVVKELVKQRLMAGAYSITVNGSDLSPGIYRIYIFVYRASDVLTSYGDVKLIN